MMNEFSIFPHSTTDRRDPGPMVYARPETAWSSFQVASLCALHELRETARLARDGSPETVNLSPSAAASGVVADLRALGGKLPFDQRLVETTVGAIEGAFSRHLSNHAGPDSWVAVQCAAQEAADRVALTVAGIADELAEDLIEMEKEDLSDPVDLRCVQAMKNVIAFMRHLLAAVSQSSEIPTA